MKSLINEVLKMRNGEIGNVVNSRINEFRSLGKEKSSKIFIELCFCLMTANCGAESCISVQKKIGNGFLTLNQDGLSKDLREAGYRFPNKRAHYIIEARKKFNLITKALKKYSGNELRDWFVNNIKGLGYKESSHFLRNIGYSDYAIIDFHIIDLLLASGLLKDYVKGRSLTKIKYLEIESTLRSISKNLGLSLAELDLYLWYIETGKVLK